MLGADVALVGQQQHFAAVHQIVAQLEADPIIQHQRQLGDLFASVLAGGVARGVSLFQAAQAAADFVRDCIARTLAEELTEQDGVDFEPLLGQLTSSK